MICETKRSTRDMDDERSSIASVLIILSYRLTLFLTYCIIWLFKLYETYSTWLYHLLRSYFIKIDQNLLTSELEKVPDHLALCIGLEDSKQVDIEKIIEIINWCQALSIKTLAIYHYSEKLSGVNLDQRMSLFKNIHVQFISLKSSHYSLIETARQICSYSPPISMNQISNHLREHYYPLPDPELLICFSDQFTLQAFPPWQIRLTEILFLPSHRFINQSLFLHELKRFARCVQRFGY